MMDDLPNLQLLRRYLRAKGWRREPLKESNALDLFTRNDPEFGELELVLPDQSSSPGVDARVEQALRTLAGLSETPLSRIAEEVKRIGFDKIEATLPNELTFRETIPLHVADTFLRQMRHILVSTAVAEFEASSVDAPGPAADDYGDACRLGHTFQGSFGFRVLSPVGPHHEYLMSNADSPPPPERRIVQRLFSGVHAASAAIAVADPNPIVSSKRGLNAEGCFALARLMERAEANEVTFGFTLSPEWMPTPGFAEHDSVSLPASSVPLLREAGRELRVRPPSSSIEIRGRVVKLSSEYIPTDLLNPGGREIGVKWSSDDFGDVVVHVRLSPAAYAEALEAHRRGRDVFVKGSIDSSGRTFRVNQPEEFRTL